MSNVISKVGQFFTDLFAKKNLLIFILTAVIVLLIMLNLKSCSGKNNQNQNTSQNEEALKKQLVVEKNKSGFYQTSVVAYEGQVKDIKLYSDSLAKEIKDLKNRKPEVIIKTQFVYVGDTASVDNHLVNEGNGNYDLDWEYVKKDSSRILRGKTSFNSKVNFLTDNKSYSLSILPEKTTILQDELRMDVVVGIAKNKKTGFDEIFVTPKDTNIHVRTLEGAILDKKKEKYLSVGIQAGYGIGYSKGNITAGPYVGLGLSYNLKGVWKAIFK